MDSEYDRKFEEMKKYIPFLESMIEKLEDTNSGSNPRQAQLDKIRSLRDLLLDKKKRMKMENLLKCEQVLVNLYAKVKERNAIPGPKSEDSSKNDKNALNVARNKLKSVVSKLQSEPVETLPEIARASETEEVCVPGSKEPALFQRRPNMPSSTPSRLSPTRNKEIAPTKRNYTRVLLSPERNESYWPSETSSEKPLFSKRSPKKSPRKHSPSYHRKERKKSFKNKSKYHQSKDLNITLNVPEDSLNSLNTKDILSRIINCSDSDVDIATLRELRTQILGELKETGTNDDISDIILKSYKNKKNKQSNKTKDEKIIKKSEVEEGELSDSESEAIKSIYGSLVVLDKNKSVPVGNKSSDKEIPRKIQICLVINSDKTKASIQEDTDKDSSFDTSDFETFNQHFDQKNNEVVVMDKVSLTCEQSQEVIANVSDDKLSNDLNLDGENTELEIKVKNPEHPEQLRIEQDKDEEVKFVSEEIKENEKETAQNVEVLKPNFYKRRELNQVENTNDKNSKDSQKIVDGSQLDTTKISNNICDETDEVNIPLLEPTEPVLEPSKEVSEIDILQALKKEILSETTNVLNTETTVSALSTPLLHQPKITKVSNAKEIGPKKRISIESYKAKAVTPSVTRSSIDIKNTVKDDISKKQSLKLTEKECERFNFLSKLTLTESSDDEDKSSLSLDDIYDLAPKSPDHEDFADTGLKPPVIIPIDPVQSPVDGSEADVDMRKLLPNVNAYDSSSTPLVSPLIVEKSKVFNTEKELTKIDEISSKVASPLVDPRMKRDNNSLSNQNTLSSESVNVEKIQSPLPNVLPSTPAVHKVNVEQTLASNANSITNRNLMITTSLQSLNITPNVNVSSNIPPLIPNLTSNRTLNSAPNMTPTMTPNIPLLLTPTIPSLMTPNRTPQIGNMTPSRTPSMSNMTPSRHAFDSEDYSNRKHVYAPMFPVGDLRDGKDNSRENNQIQWDSSDSRSSFWEDRNISNSLQRDIDYRDQNMYSMQRDVDYRRSHSVQRDIDFRDIRNSSVQNSYSFDQRDSDLIQYPPTPNHPFGGRDCPPTPTPSFGRVDRPMTPVHPFGRSDCPLTPSHPFGRSEPLLPLPNFGRSEYSQPATRSQDPRLNRNADYDNNQYRDDDRERAYYKDRQFNSGSYDTEHHLFGNYHREQSVGRNERNKSYDYRDKISRRETSLSRSFHREDRDYGRSFNREYDPHRYSRTHSKRGRGYDYRNDSNNYDEGHRRTYKPERGVGKTQDTVSNLTKERKPCSKSSEDNKLCISPHGGPSFIIDTSVNSSFQDMNTRSKSSSSFDARRQRASSVGRTLHSIRKTLTHETKHIFYDPEKNNRSAKNFRRACSVGREVHDDKKFDFKDIKADLKSFKFNSNFKFSRDNVRQNLSLVSTENPKSDKYRSEQKVMREIYDKPTFSSKYSPRKNDRDPRMRRESLRDIRDKSSSRDFKSYGIVYSTDNISKGTILGPGYGVKNYKIPKIKRPIEVIETSKKTNYDEESVSCSKNESNESKSPNEMKDHKSENSLNETKITTAQNVTSNDVPVSKDSDKTELLNDDSEQVKEKIEEFNEIENSLSENSCSGKNNNKYRKPNKLQITKKILSDDDTKDQNKTEINNLKKLSDSMDSTERRVTRSTRKSMPEESISLELSPVKRTRKVKKSLVLESDSDDNDNYSKPNSEEFKKLSRETMHTSVTENSDKKSELIETNEAELENELSEIANTEQQEVDSNKIVKSILQNSIVDEKEKQIDEVLDSSFGLGDLEMFTDNMTSDPVIDNINALIADLDHDLDSSKNTDANSHFTNEINLETMLENITSPVKTDKKEIENGSPHEKDISEMNKPDVEIDIKEPSTVNTMASNVVEQTDVSKRVIKQREILDGKISYSKAESDGFEILTSDNSMNNKIQDSETLDISKRDSSKESDIQDGKILYSKAGSDGSEILTSDNSLNNKVQDNETLDISKRDSSKQSDTQEGKILYNKAASDGSEILTSANNINDKIQDSETLPDSFEKECERFEPCVPPLAEINKVNVEDPCSNDAIVSTSEDGNVLKLDTSLKNVSHCETADSPSTPDSTINSNIDDIVSKSVLPLADESGCEMNSDITSTHVTDSSNKETLELVSSDAGNPTEIESILSILKDKTKMKELLSLLDNQSSQKMKKKLEKLSEIVSDDESEVGNNLAEKSGESKSSNQIVNANSDKKVTKVNEEINKIDFDTNVLNIQEKKAMQSNYELSNVQVKDKGVLEKSCSIENNSTTDQAVNDYKEAEKNCLEEDIGTTNKVICNKSKIVDINSEAQIDNSVNNISQENIIEKYTEEADETKIKEPSICENVEKNQQNEITEDEKFPIKKKRRRRGKKRIGNKSRKPITVEDKRVTRSDSINLQSTPSLEKPVPKKPSRELKQLQEDIREMFIKDDILSSTGIRMCRIAKLVDEKKKKEDVSTNESNNQEPLIVLEKHSDLNVSEKSFHIDKIRKKKITYPKNKDVDANNSNHKTPNINSSKTGTVVSLDSKTKLQETKHDSLDPYTFETDSVTELNNESDTKNDSSSESESDSVASTKSSGSTELVETKKKVKRRRGRLWQAGVIKQKHKKKKLDQKLVSTTSTDNAPVSETRKVPDFTCFTDRTYCFRKHVSTYNCRICLYTGTDIVHHYKKEHPHTEVPLSRLSPAVSKEAIKESEDVNFQEISKVSSKKYVCRFCFKEFSRKRRLLEAFFWHIVSMHTGEYKQTCPKCVDTQICPLDIDIPPPPKDANGQLLGYICEKCNYTQISLENLKTHVIVWHNDEQTAVYTINLANLSKDAISTILSHSQVDSEKPRLLRSSRSNRSMAEASGDESDSTEELSENLKKKPNRKEVEPVVENNVPSNIQSKITFESDVTDEIFSNYDASETTVKIESDTNDLDSHFDDSHSESEKQADEMKSTEIEKPNTATMSQEIFNYPHFKIKISQSGSKEYVCCINGNDNHYKTSLLISMKKHVQLKHTEKWDGYCCICKVIVTPQGEHKFKECLQHFLDKHIDDFPTLEEIPVTHEPLPENIEPPLRNEVLEPVTNKAYINVRPLSELISGSRDPQQTEDVGPVLPVIESVISLGAQVEQSRPSPSYPTPIKENVETLKQYKYEEFQADIMSKKQLVVLDAMMSHKKLVQVFKCAGRFCFFTTDSAEDALLHASTHMRIGGVDSLSCAYCDYDTSGNAIHLITHVFKYHGCCPYVCSMCFYRAAASQLVNAHIKRVHDKATDVKILKTAFQTSPLPEDCILSREAAVPYYLCCGKNSPDGPCKFRTYTPGKFSEHLQMRHPTSTEFFCFICSSSVSTPAELICHLKTHGLKVYQCPWCVFGADDEAELIAHASALHPNRQPKAYLRIITNKEGTNELRVLPLAHLNKHDIPAVEVAPNTQKDFPVREAERSIELEKLIGHTNFMIESMSTTENMSIQGETGLTSDVSLLETMNILESTETLIPRMTTPVPSENTIDKSEQSTPILKADTTHLPHKKISQPESEIVCLDSDDEESPPIVTSIPVAPSAENTQLLNSVENAIKKVELTELFVCSKCKNKLKCGAGFRKHINACFSNMCDRIPCVHCPLSFSKKYIVTHYNTHCDRNKDLQQYYCYRCLMGLNSFSKAKEHLMTTHGAAKSGTSLPEWIKEVVTGPKRRRKRSLEIPDIAVEPPEKVTRYGPQDIDKLPINPILDSSVACSLCEFKTKVRLNMVRHLQQHAQQQPVPQTAPVNPVPHLETNEKHFDKMVNLASSSIGARSADKSNKAEANASVTLSVPPEAASRYPKFVSDKQRLTCGAKDCSYISVDESMLKCHWETLHHGTNDFHCVHCPPYQNLDKSRPLTAARIIGHLKMHEDTLYACSLCSYYHYRRQILEKHLVDYHNKAGHVMIVREGKVGEINAPTAANASVLRTSAPTMDLKPWQCGLCKFKSLLRQEVVDHCAKVHNSKMQYKCAYCAFRTSNPENITKHQSKSHVGKPEEIFYFYYREGSVPDDADGTTRWQKQSQGAVTSVTRVKSEDQSEITPSSLPKSHSILRKLVPAVDLNLVKKELEPAQETIEDLCKEFGAFCEPNGLKYKCSLCSNVIEDSLEAMQSHLYEELKYRKWGCSICAYKAFHKEGFSEHMQTEHRQNRDPIALPVDSRVETWVAKLLEHQTNSIAKYKENLAKQKEEILRTNPGPSTSKSQPQQAKESSNNVGSTNKPDLQKIFGPFGASSNSLFCCPKCSSSFKEVDLMHSHLESELNKIRWFCSNCAMKFQTYHEAQFHSRSVHIGQSARPVEVTRDATVRAAWIDAVIKTQKQSMDTAPIHTPTKKSFHQIEDMSEPENSLLVVRYEEKIPTPEEEMARKTPATIPPAPLDSDDEKLVIDEPLENRKASKPSRKCLYCPYVTPYEKVMRDHVLRHYGLKQFNCPYCDLNGTRKAIEKHQKMYHPSEPINLVPATIPTESPTEYYKKFANSPTADGTLAKVVCLVCRHYFTETESLDHIHDNILTTFGKKGDVVVQCSDCRTLHKDTTAYWRHHKMFHSELDVNYVFCKLNTVTGESKELLYACGNCSQKFSQLKDLKTHADANHQSMLKYTLVPKHPNSTIIEDYEENSSKRKSDDDAILPPCKRTARKSTTKLPLSRSARKSTTKLPFHVPCETEEFSYYGMKPSTEGLEEVVAMIPFCNKIMPFTFSRLKDMINIDPAVVVHKNVNP